MNLVCMLCSSFLIIDDVVLKLNSRLQAVYLVFFEGFFPKNSFTNTMSGSEEFVNVLVCM